MSAPSDKEQIYAITRYLEGLSEGQSANAKATIAELNTKLSSIFGTDNKSVDNFLALDYGSDLADILKAGVSRLNAGLYESDLAEAQADPHYAPYTQVILGRQYLSGTIDGTYENLRRKSRMLAKYRKHCPKTNLTIDNPEHPLRTAFIKTSGRWPWADQSNQVQVAPPMKETPPPPPPTAAKAPEPPKPPPVKEAPPAKITEDYSKTQMANTNFFKKVGSKDQDRDYTIIVDKSASMKLAGRWKQAEAAVKRLAKSCCECDSDGITLYFFSSHSKTSKGEFPAFNKYENVSSEEDVMKLFAAKENVPKGGTDLTKVLKDAFIPTPKPSTILVITDGKPDDINTTEKLIIETSQSLKTPEELLVTIVQVGNDDKADEYLNELDNKLVGMGAKYDIVDIIPNAKLATMDFAMIVDLAMKHHE